MRFAETTFLYLLLLIPALGLFFYYVSKERRNAISRFGNSQLMAMLTKSLSTTKRKVKIGFILIGLFFLIIAMARPQIGSKLRMAKKEGIDLMIALDTSQSMLAEDIKPNRLLSAKMAASELLKKLRGDRVGLIAFAGTGFVQCPLTTDYSAAKMFLDNITSDLIPQPGTAIGEAIQLANKSFVAKASKQKVLILLTDGEDHISSPIDAAKEAAKNNLTIYTVGLGSLSGDPIPERDARGNIIGHKKDRKGNIVLSKLDEETLKKVAEITDGEYYRSTVGGGELDKIFEEITGMEKSELETRFYTDYEERFQYFLIFALAFLTVEFFISERKKR
jgi:Ca-activated chloride channel family protein